MEAGEERGMVLDRGCLKEEGRRERERESGGGGEGRQSREDGRDDRIKQGTKG